MPLDLVQVVSLALPLAVLLGGGWALLRVRRRSREIRVQIEELGHTLGRLEAALADEAQERARQDGELEQRSTSRLEAAVAPVLERMVELGRVQREAARVARAVAEGRLEASTAVHLERHLAELTADLATDEEPDS